MEIAQAWQLRTAGGMSWLLDMRQAGMPYKRPLPVNEVGAELWRLVITEGMSLRDACQRMSADYGVPGDMIRADAEGFFSQLCTQGVLPEEWREVIL